MFQTLKNIIHDLIVWSGIVNYFLPIIKIFIVRYIELTGRWRQTNYVVADASGATINLTRLKGRLYVPFTEDRLLEVPQMEIRKSDVLLCGYPKTGCHWMHEILHMLQNQKAELTKHGKELGGMIDSVPEIILRSLPSPRVLNSHLLYEQLPAGVKENKIKIIYTVRNPKDTLVSYYNHHINLKIYGYSGKFDDYFQLFMDGNLDYGSYFDHVLAWDKVIRNQSHNPILLISFEEIKEKPLETVKRVAAFLDMEITDNFASDVVTACHFEKMKAVRQKDNNFDATMFRKGIVGDWRNWLTDDQSQAIDNVWLERMMDCMYQPTY